MNKKEKKDLKFHFIIGCLLFIITIIIVITKLESKNKPNFEFYEDSAYISVNNVNVVFTDSCKAIVHGFIVLKKEEKEKFSENLARTTIKNICTEYYSSKESYDWTELLSRNIETKIEDDQMCTIYKFLIYSIEYDKRRKND